MLCAALVGLGGSGALRALQTVFGPLNIALTGVRNAIVPAAAQDLNSRGLRTAGAIVGVLASIGTLVMVALLWAAPGLGRFMMGENWPGDHHSCRGLARSDIRRLGLGRPGDSRASDRTYLSVRLRILTAATLLVPFVCRLSVWFEIALGASSVATLGAAGVWWWFAAQTDRRC